MSPVCSSWIELLERAYFDLCLTLGRLLRSARYTNTQIVEHDGQRAVRKQRSSYAPLLVWLGGPLVRILDTGVRVLPQREWQERERELYQRFHGKSIRIEANGTLVLPFLPGKTLASLLENQELDVSTKEKAIKLAVSALVEFHGAGFTHGDAMAENVLVDLDAGVAHWIDFETIHDARRSIPWRRADDVRALLATCLVRAGRGKHGETLQLILNAYAGEDLAQLLAASFTTRWPIVRMIRQPPAAVPSEMAVAATRMTGTGTSVVETSPALNRASMTGPSGRSIATRVSPAFVSRRPSARRPGSLCSTSNRSSAWPSSSTTQIACDRLAQSTPAYRVGESIRASSLVLAAWGHPRVRDVSAGRLLIGARWRAALSRLSTSPATGPRGTQPGRRATRASGGGPAFTRGASSATRPGTSLWSSSKCCCAVCPPLPSRGGRIGGEVYRCLVGYSAVTPIT